MLFSFTNIIILTQIEQIGKYFYSLQIIIKRIIHLLYLKVELLYRIICYYNITKHYKTMLHTFLNILATIISVISLLIVAYGVFVGFIAFLRNEIKRFNGTYTINNIRKLRADFGSYLLLGLEFLIASDILKTVVDPSLDELAILGGVVVVRTVLSVFLNKEIKELAEEEDSKSA